MLERLNEYARHKCLQTNEPMNAQNILTKSTKLNNRKKKLTNLWQGCYSFKSESRVQHYIPLWISFSFYLWCIFWNCSLLMANKNINSGKITRSIFSKKDKKKDEESVKKQELRIRFSQLQDRYRTTSLRDDKSGRHSSTTDQSRQTSILNRRPFCLEQ